MTDEAENYKSVQQTSPCFSAIFGLLVFFINHSCFVKCFFDSQPAIYQKIKRKRKQWCDKTGV